MLIEHSAPDSKLRIAVVHDWLYTVGGAERVLAGILRCLPGADVYCLFDVLAPESRRQIGYEESRTSFLQHMPGVRRHHRLYFPLMPFAIEQLDLSAYDLVVSSSYCVAKGVLTGPDQLHISYVHSPMRYAWNLQHHYLREGSLQRGVRSVLARACLHTARIWDVRTAHGVDSYIANSFFVARRIKKAYGRSAEVIYPPVAVPDCLQIARKEHYFVAASRLVPYKNIRPIVEAFRLLPNERLLVVGSGPEERRLRAVAGTNVSFLGHVPDAEFQRVLASARALVFAAEEDFGIVVVEAQSRGTPVIALGRGGARETVLANGVGPTGLFFEEALPQAIAASVRRFIAEEDRFTALSCYNNARRFAEAQFDSAFSSHVRACRAAFASRLALPPGGTRYPPLDDAAD